MSETKAEVAAANRRGLLVWIGGAAAVLALGIALWLTLGSGAMGERLREQLPELFEELPLYLGGHMRLSVVALAVGVAFSLPLGILISGFPRAAEWVVGVAGVLQTIPSLALLALMVPLLGGAIGFWPAFVAMMLYSLLPILKNTVDGIKNVDPTLVEAARGLGMSKWQIILRVQLPQAQPAILTGVRIATVLVVGSATLATPVGDRTLGNYIFIGLNTRDYVQVVFGCVMAALLAVVFDQLIRLIESALKPGGDRRLLYAGGVGLLVLVAGGLYRPVSRAMRPPTNPVTIGTHDYTEQYVLGEVMKDTLTARGYDVDWRKGMAQQFTLDAVCNGEIDACVDYTGNVWTNRMKRERPAGREETLAAVSDFLSRDENGGVQCLGVLGFENAYALAIRKADAVRLRIETMDDLRKHAPGMTIGGDLMFFKLNEWKHVQETYGLKFADAPRELDPTLMYEAIKRHSVDVIVAYTTDARLEAYDLVIVTDSRKAFPTYDAILLLSRKASQRGELRAALQGLATPLDRKSPVHPIDQARMIRANRRIDVERSWPRKAARELLEQVPTRAEGGS